jgi:hypothetical protein
LVRCTHAYNCDCDCGCSGDALQVIEGVFHQQIDEFKNVLGVYFGGDVEKLERTKLRFGNALIDQLLWSQGQET